MRAVYVPDDEEFWTDYFLEQAQQTGHGGLAGFEGVPFQRGAGIGSFLGRIFRTILPVFKTVGKKAAKAVGKEALNVGAHVASDLVQGRDFEESIKEHGKAAAGSLLKRGAAHFTSRRKWKAHDVLSSDEENGENN